MVSNFNPGRSRNYSSDQVFHPFEVRSLISGYWLKKTASKPNSRSRACFAQFATITGAVGKAK